MVRSAATEGIDAHAAALREEVRQHYAAAARAASAGNSCCGDGCGCGEPAAEEAGFGSALYGREAANEVPEAALRASLGCGNPTAVAELVPGEVVLDLGSGGGIDVLLSAKRVMPGGLAYGLDMTEEMLQLARRNARAAGVTNVEFLSGTIESIPLPDGAVDVILSNCVINLSVDKPAVFREALRVIRPGGRLALSDVVAGDSLSAAERAELGSYVGCVAGALTRSEYAAGLRAAGFEGVSVTPTHSVADGIASALIRASKPSHPA
ncbi:MAG: arsenite methyltransferase [Candidatus Dormibacteria bacterium]